MACCAPAALILPQLSAQVQPYLAITPDGAFWSGWQEGAIISAWEAVKSIDRQNNSSDGQE
jgi:monoamine oxidase